MTTTIENPTLTELLSRLATNVKAMDRVWNQEGAVQRAERKLAKQQRRIERRILAILRDEIKLPPSNSHTGRVHAIGVGPWLLRWERDDTGPVPLEYAFVEPIGAEATDGANNGSVATDDLGASIVDGLVDLTAEVNAKYAERDRREREWQTWEHELAERERALLDQLTIYLRDVRQVPIFIAGDDAAISGVVVGQAFAWLERVGDRVRSRYYRLLPTG